MGEDSDRAGGGYLARGWFRRALVLALIGAHFGLVFFSVRHKSATSDEPYHLARGVSTLFSGDFRMAESHPPLINVITALPLLFFRDLQVPFGEPAFDFTYWHNPRIDPAERKNNFFKFLLWIHDIPGWPGNPDPLAIIFWCRVPVMVLSAALALTLYLWTARALSPRAGLAALALYCFSPTVIAQSGLITNDTGGGLFIFLYGLSLAWHLRAPSAKRLLLCGFLFGLAQLAKHTSILLIPLTPIIFFLMTDGKPAEKLRAFFSPKNYLGGLPAAVAIMVIGAVTIWAGYGFELHSIHQYEIPDPAPITHFRHFLARHVIRAIAFLHLPPPTYYFGLCRTLFDSTKHPLPLFFLGRQSAQGWWYYYPVMFLMKEPVALLVLAGICLVVLFRKKALPKPARTVALTMSIGVLLFFMFLNQKNIGLRHVLPLYPFVFMLMAGLFEARVTANAWVRRAGWGLVGVYAVNAFWSYPDYLVHFNSLVGGPDGGLRYSVVGEDWGQDIWALGDYCQEHKIAVMHYNPYGNADPRAYGVPYKKFKCEDPIEDGWYAVHVVDLRRPKKEVGPECVKYFIEGKPVAVLHHTIYVYKIVTGKE